ncbi:MAG TPA: NAD-dependent epimerase/dehydratase family protein [Acidimicrobiia bacterium]|nr:NAD-dependent epimerase/dehydratase family protein [Acidimicrobiia bacterium]
MRILVTGGAGFIGSHVVEELVAARHEVVVVDSLHPAAHHAPPVGLIADVEYHWIDLSDVATLVEVLDGVDAVSHQAAMVGMGLDFRDIVAYTQANDVGTASLLRAMHDVGFVGRLVLASSMVIYGEGAYSCPRHGAVVPEPRDTARLEQGEWEPVCPGCGAALTCHPVLESARPDPRSVYAATKLQQEHLCAVFGRDHDVPVVALRYHNVYGPMMPRDTPYAGVASIFRSALEGGRSPQVYEDGGQRRDFVHVRDVARANRLALESSSSWRGPLNVASGRPRTVLDLAAELCTAFGADTVPEVVPRFRVGDVRHVFASADAAERELGFRAEVPFADGVREFATAPMRDARAAAAK